MGTACDSSISKVWRDCTTRRQWGCSRLYGAQALHLSNRGTGLDDLLVCALLAQSSELIRVDAFCPGRIGQRAQGPAESESEIEVAQSRPTLCDPMDCSLPGSSLHGILQARILEWVAISFSRGSSQLRDRTWVSCIAGKCFNLWATREAPQSQLLVYNTWASLINL